MSSSVWIVLVNYNGLDDTRRCLRSIEKMDEPRPNVILVDNASAIDPRAELEAEFPWCAHYRNAENEGWSGGNNTGIRYALDQGADYVFLLNNDTEIAPNAVTRLLAAAEALPEFGIIGPVINVLGRPDEVMTDGCRFNDPEEGGFFRRQVVKLCAGDPPTVVPTDIVNGCAMFVRRSVFEQIGLVDDRFFLIHEESDFCLRSSEAGLPCGILAESLVWHKQSSSFARVGKHWQRYYDCRNSLLLIWQHPARSTRQRGRLASMAEYAKSVYYWYSLEKEAHQDRAADACIEGMLDAFARRYGPMVDRRRLLVPAIRFAFEQWRLFKLWRSGRAGRLASIPG